MGEIQTMRIGAVTPKVGIDWIRVADELRDFARPDSHARQKAIGVVQTGIEQGLSTSAECVRVHQDQPVQAAIRIARHVAYLAKEHCQSFPHCRSDAIERWELADFAVECEHRWRGFAKLVTLVDEAWKHYEEHRAAINMAEEFLLTNGGRGTLSLAGDLERHHAAIAPVQLLGRLFAHWRDFAGEHQELRSVLQAHFASTLLPLRHLVDCPSPSPELVADYFVWCANFDSGVRFDRVTEAHVREELRVAEAFCKSQRPTAPHDDPQEEAKWIAGHLRACARKGSDFSDEIHQHLARFAELKDLDPPSRTTFINALSPAGPDQEGIAGRKATKAATRQESRPPTWSEGPVVAAGERWKRDNQGK